MSENGAPSLLLARVDRVQAALAEVKTLADVGAVLDDLERLRRYAKAAKWTLDAQNEIGRGWFLAQRKGGEIWAAMEKQRPGQYQQRFQNGTVEIPPTMAEYGLTKKQAMYWQRYAAIDELEFLAILDEIAEVRRLTTTALIPYLLPEEHRQRTIRLGQSEPGRALVYEAGYRELLPTIPDASVDLLLTDPPYSTDVPDVDAFARAWVPAVLPKVTRSGRAYICIGAYPAELRAYLDVLLGQDHLTLDQVLVWSYRNTLGPEPTHRYKQSWQAILLLSGPGAGSLAFSSLVDQLSVIDLPTSDGAGTHVHGWQKPDALADRLVRHAMPDGGSVLDPFAGTGAFLAAAARAGGRAIGSEVDPSMLAFCEQRQIEVIRAEA